ncbi:MAG: serine/threonine-protein kinase [Candidatus Margulisiibacteriota bacterium]
MQTRPINRIKAEQSPARELFPARRLSRGVYPGTEKAGLSLSGLEQFGRRTLINITARAAEAYSPAVAGSPENPLDMTIVFMANSGNTATNIMRPNNNRLTTRSLTNHLNDKMTSFQKRYNSLLLNNWVTLSGVALSVGAGFMTPFSWTMTAAFSFLPIPAPVWAPAALVSLIGLGIVGLVRAVGRLRVNSSVEELKTLAEGREKNLAGILHQLGDDKKVDYLLNKLPQALRDKVAQELVRLSGLRTDRPDSLALELAYDALNEYLALPAAEQLAKETEIASLIEEINTASKELGFDLVPQARSGSIIPYVIVPANAAAKQKIKALADRKNDKGLPDPDVPPLIDGGCFLGRGGMGEVYLTFNPQDRKFYAVKIMLPQHLSSGAAIDSFREEYDVQERLNHPAVVNAFAFGRFEKNSKKTSDCPYFVMELIEGVDLEEYARKLNRRLAPQEALVFLAKICDAMIAITNERVTHRDLKLSNIFVILNGLAKMIKIGDFGLLANIDKDDKSATGILKGTVTYMSPEYPHEYANLTKLEREARASAGTLFPILVRHDLYAVGVILYRLLRGSALIWEHNGQLYKTSPNLLQPGTAVDGRTKRDITEISWLFTYAADYKAYREAKAVGSQVVMDDIKAKYRLLPLGDEPVERAITELVQEATSIDPAERPQNFTGLRDRIVALFNQYFPGQLMDDSFIQAELLTAPELSFHEESSEEETRPGQDDDEKTKPRLSGEEPTNIDGNTPTNPLLSNTAIPTLPQLVQTINSGSKPDRLLLLQNIEQYVDDTTVASLLIPVLQRFIKVESDPDLKAAGRSAMAYLFDYIQNDLDDNGGTA